MNRTIWRSTSSSPLVSAQALRQPIVSRPFDAANLVFLQRTQRTRRRLIGCKCAAASVWQRRTRPLARRQGVGPGQWCTRALVGKLMRARPALADATERYVPSTAIRALRLGNPSPMPDARLATVCVQMGGGATRHDLHWPLAPAVALVACPYLFVDAPYVCHRTDLHAARAQAKYFRCA